MSSKIKVDTIENVAGSGNVSLGSGHNLVVPGTTTITGATTLNGGATVLGNTIVNPDTAGKSTFQFTSQAANDAKLIMKSDTTDKVTIHANGTTILNGGAVTMPSQPSFAAYGIQSSPSSGSVLIYGTEAFDIGGNYDTSNGRFTAPVAGLYIFYCTAIGPNRATVTRYYTRKNGNAYPHASTQLRLEPASANHDYGTSAVIMQMAASDYADIYFTADDGGSTHGSSSSGHEMFSGHLIG